MMWIGHHRCSAPLPGDRHALAGRGHDRREQVRVVVDRRKEILHLIALVDHVVGEEEAPPRAAVGTRGPGTSCNPASMRRGRRSREPPGPSGISLKASPLTTVTTSSRPARLMFAFASRARWASYSMVVSLPPVSRSPRPIQMALYPLAAPISSARFAPLDATMSRRNRPSSSDTASWPLSARRISSSNPCKAGVRPGERPAAARRQGQGQPEKRRGSEH